ncbi:uncharacterized protein A4U43_C04F21170 [Asparagus officinalis]|uniref:Fatty acyl-CoA reductase n=1 Tax=Asparagus officinalis TaxID=4686 RepID=A0A5P1F5B3_ASPOF|nr:fatty acyl-CoA reductase 2-like [Asparagus officinalis]ONK72607.1 uncharacterized protein A4U43_C04F21170 [Asparagus officinalis]
MASLSLTTKPNAFAFSGALRLLITKKKKDVVPVFCSCNNGNDVRNEYMLATKGSKSEVSHVVPSKGTNPTYPTKDLDEGIGIIRFLKGKHLFITGATGFFAKVLIEKILRMMPDIGKIYVLIKAKNKDAAMSRLKSEIINCEVFSSLREIHGKDYEDFMIRKLMPVVGNVMEARLGMQGGLADEISEEVDVIVNSAANTTFDERYDAALDINTMGPFRLMSFARRCKKLKLFVHVSTAYVNGQRQGRVLEEPLSIGDTIVPETIVSSDVSEKSIPFLDIGTEMKLAFSSAGRTTSGASSTQDMKDLGLTRANTHGWADAYTFTKAMGEMVINSMRGDIPIVIVRPSIIESTFKEPFPGWIEGSRMMDPLVLYYGKGKIAGFVGDPNGVLDVVPVDMVVNATLAALAKHGQRMENGMQIYHVGSSVAHPLLIKDLVSSFYEHFEATPCFDSNGKPIVVSPFKLFIDKADFSTNNLNDIVGSGKSGVDGVSEKHSQRTKSVLVKYVEQLKYLATLYEPYTFCAVRFDDTNTRKLMQEMSKEEMRSFDFDVRGIAWDDYIANVHIPGLRKYVMKERGVNVVSDAEK